MSTVNKVVVHHHELGEQGVLPNGGIINAGGTQGPNFSVGGKPLIFADGTATDGSGQVIQVGGPGAIVRGYEHIQTVASNTWIIPHFGNTKKIHVTIWDESDEVMFTDVVKIVDLNTVVVILGTPAIGRAVLLMF